MQEFFFYIKLGLNHVLDFGAYDHLLFLSALAIPFSFKDWKKVVILATVFTLAHCLSLALSAFEVLTVAVGVIEFLIPVTILLTALYNFKFVMNDNASDKFYINSMATAFFGIIHGFGFSNYFKMLMAQEEDKAPPLLGFAAGIELSQVAIILVALAIAFVVQNLLKVKRTLFVALVSILIICITIPLLIATFPQ